ncbi:BON domain-containing protein [Legionella sp. km772]|uniref:BON domain-containing protein n=1 Tax=Legionella sp. km772 TaxID=2498111 RepID=UPI000F8EC546|nr:BON domain-containing protein [Legionella sp. km772]RUR09233.1 BON domain-containing protein [Legionella sp. km772]
MHRLIYTPLLTLLFFINTVQANNLTEIEQNISDTVITTKITAKYTENKLNPLKIAIETKDGVVNLSGQVKDKQAFIDALRIAKNTAGVRAVQANDLEIKKTNSSFTDTFITARVETAVLKAKVLDDESIPLVGINAKTINGVVTLSGQVKNAQSIAFIIKRVNAIPGVKKIITYLEVRDET